MPALNRFTWFGLCLCVILGAWCSPLVAQTATKTKRYPSDESPTIKRTVQREPAVEAPAAAPGKAALNNRGNAAPNGVTQSRTAQGPARPVGQAMRIRKISPEMQAILEEWEEKSSKVKRLEGTFKRVSYDPVFEVESVTEGKYCFEFPDKGSFHQVGLDQNIADRMQSRKLNSKGKPYKVQPGENERWICDGNYIFKIEEKSKSYEKIAIPEEDKGQNIKNAPLPFVFGLKANEAKQRYDFELVEKGTNEQQIRLKVTPLLPQDLANYSMAEVILDRANCLPIAVKLTDPTGKKTDVYSFEKKDMVVNSKGWVRWLAGNPLKPNLSGLKQNIHSDMADRGGLIPVDRRNGAERMIGPKKTAQLPEEEEPLPPRRSSRPQPRNE